ncbi:MAG: GntR family transcriptional regulator [Candidatus Dormibacteria bacterium]
MAVSSHREGPQSKSDLVVEAVREMIVAGEMLPGTPLRQRHLASRLGVSPTPVREAIRRLQAEGLVCSEINRGATVADTDRFHLEESLQILGVLEVLAGRLAVERLQEQDLSEIQRLHQRLAQCRPDDPRRRNLNRNFHFRVYECAGSPMLMSIMRLLWAAFPGGPQFGRPLEESVEQHGRLVQSLASRDPEAVAQVIQEHVLGTMPFVRPRQIVSRPGDRA